MQWSRHPKTLMRQNRAFIRAGLLAAMLAVLLFSLELAFSAELTAKTNVIGPSPEILGLNSGHFYPGSNTRDWWRYSGVSGARFFISPSNIEPSDDISPVGDGVTDSATFLARRASIRTNQFDPSYINWPVFENRYQNTTLSGNNRIRVDYALSALREMNVEICAQITASQSRLPIASASDWPNMWELWQHYYAQSFYLARHYNVARYQMYNEPNHPDANGLTPEDYLLRLRLASDAVQCAIDDVNTLYGKQLRAKMLAPVTAGSAASSWTGWGELVVTNRHVNFLGQTDPDFLLLHVYDYHQYGSTPAGFGSSLQTLHGYLAQAMAPEPRYPSSISEFNTRTGASFDSIPDTLDYPAEYSQLGAICVNLAANHCSELYCFKFSQTESSNENYPVQKNALHYVDSDTSPYNIGGITKAGEVWRLFNKSLPRGSLRLETAKGSGATGLDVQSARDSNAFYLFSANNTSTAVDVSLNLQAWEIPANNKIMIQEVSESLSGGVRLFTNAGAAGTLFASLASNSVWLIRASQAPQAPEQILLSSADAEVRNGANKLFNYGLSNSITVRNDPSSAANRSVAFVKFQLPTTNDMSRLQFAVLALSAQSTTEAPAQAQVYAIDSNDWSETTLTWNNAPNLRDNVPAGNRITNAVVESGGISAHVQGQLITSSTVTSERRIDVTDYLRGRTNAQASFLIAQEPRWNLALPSLDVGDTQPGGIRITSKEGGAGPRLHLVFAVIQEPPVAVDDTYATLQDTTLRIGMPGVLTNDTSGTETNVVARIEEFPTNGSVVLREDGSFMYTPEPGFYGADCFTYVAAALTTSSAPALVRLTVERAFPVSTNVAVSAEAFIRGGAYADTNPDEAATGYLMVKYNASLDLSRKTFLRFDVSALSPNNASDAALTINFVTSFKHAVQLWCLDQPWGTFNSDVTWNSAQANEAASNDMLQSGPFTATRIGSSTLMPMSGMEPFTFTVPDFAQRIPNSFPVFVLTGVADQENNAGGLRIEPGSATLTLLANVPVPADAASPVFTGWLLTNGLVSMTLQGTPGTPYVVEFSTDLVQAPWERLATNVSDANGVWLVTDAQRTNSPARFYRAFLP